MNFRMFTFLYLGNIYHPRFHSNYNQKLIQSGNISCISEDQQEISQIQELFYQKSF